MKPIIEFKDFSFQYFSQKNPTLKNINLTINQGEKVLICGLSGSGKSTLGNCINGLIPFVYEGEVSGQCIIDGKDQSKMSVPELSKIVGTVLQDSDGQFVGLTVGEDIAFAMENDCVDVKSMHDRVLDISKKICIEDLLEKVPGELSGGQKQRVSLAGVMVDDVKILLFDEPLANLDPATGKNTIELIDEISKETGATIVIIEHRIEDVLHRHVDRVILFEDGEIKADTTPDKLLASNILIESGIREPLYISACKFADVSVKEENFPSDINKFTLNGLEKENIKVWVKENAPSQKEKGEVVLKLDNLNFSYDGLKPNVKDVSFEVYKGEMLAIVGKNGAGKSTISKLLSGFLKLDSGNIYLNGKGIGGDTIFERGQKIGLVLQNSNQMICNTMIFDEVAYGLKNMKVPETEIKERVEEVLKVCGLYPFRNWPISALSYGQRKRVTIASIIVMKPDIIILDEPTAGQDFRHYTEIMNFLKSLNKLGQTIIMITHDMHLMLEYCDRCVTILDGEKIFDGSCAEVLVNDDIVEKANLKKTSLYMLAEMVDEDPIALTESYINAERRNRNEG
ncbi:MAG: ABC transporter ATP-binding protein [Erysipelotrichaceae bacterium]|nr:ABC transporter ATP-binding protein [Erysipelotrichaceae bacterium]